MKHPHNLILSHISRGRTEAKACQNCEDINDSELNKEIFDLPWRQQNSNGTDGDTEDEVPKNGERVRSEAERSVSGRQQLIEETEGIEQEHNRLGPIRENIPVGEQVRGLVTRGFRLLLFHLYVGRDELIAGAFRPISYNQIE